MSQLELFFKDAFKPAETVNYIATERNPVEWIIRPLTAAENEAIKKECMVTKTVEHGRKQKEFDDEKYGSKVVAKAVVFPDLQNKELQDNWGVMSPEALLGKMLIAGEYLRLQAKCLEVSGFELPSQDDGVDEELVEDAEN